MLTLQSHASHVTFKSAWLASYAALNGAVLACGTSLLNAAAACAVSAPLSWRCRTHRFNVAVAQRRRAHVVATQPRQPRRQRRILRVIICRGHLDMSRP